MDSLYTVDVSNKYFGVAKRIRNLEDIDGDFLTEEEAREALGLQDHQEVGSGHTYRYELIRDGWAVQVARLTEGGGKQVEIDDKDLLVLINNGWYGAQPPDGYRIKDGVLFRINRRAPKPNRQDVKDLVYHGAGCVHKKYPGVDFNIFRPQEAPKSSITVLTKLITWEELEESLENASASVRPAMIKLLWDNPALLGC